MIPYRFWWRPSSEGEEILIIGAVLALATLLVTYLIVHTISKRLWHYGVLYYLATNVVSLLFSIIAVNNEYIRINGSADDILVLYLSLVGGFILLSVLVGMVVNRFWGEKYP